MVKAIIRSFLLVVFVLAVFSMAAAVATASDLSFSTGIYAAVSEDGELGYETGFGVYAREEVRYSAFSVFAEGQYMLQEKLDATEGYRYRAGVQGRWYFWKGLYCGAGYWWRGYKSEFDDGTTWKKLGYGEAYHIGFVHELLDINFTLAPKEFITESEIKWFSGSIRYRVYNHISAIIEITDTNFKHLDRRISGISTAFKMGVEF